MEVISTLEETQLTNKAFSGEYSEKIWNIIPKGKRNFNFPLRQISSVRYQHDRNWVLVLIFAGITIVMVSQLMGEIEVPAVIWSVICGFLTYWFFKGTHGVFIQTSGGDSELIMSRAQTGEVKKFTQEINNAIAENC